MTQSKFAFRLFCWRLPRVASSPLLCFTLSLSLSLRIRSVANAVAAAAVAESYQKASANVADNESEMNSSLCE